MVQGRNGAGFALEPLAELFCGNFDRNITAKAGVTRLPHFPHAALADGRKELIGAQAGTSRDSHTGIFDSNPWLEAVGRGFVPRSDAGWVNQRQEGRRLGR